MGWITSRSSTTTTRSTTLSGRSESLSSGLSDAVLGDSNARYATQFQGVPYSWSGVLLPGVLIFFDANGPGASHVGIYIGNVHFVHSGGRAVSVTDVSNPYWRVYFVGAKRITDSV
ncbi:C40 family peptidase [Ferroacidibacillus organovorans]|uniref:C40 family peptidase n=1 Tax=Ferroacidibacillus organovorans TaxID=1765683 RepID=UPI0009EE99D5